MKNIAVALLKAQKKIENATKDANNPHFKSKYATLESVLDAVKDVSNEMGIVIVQTGGKDVEGHFIETKLIHESGEEISSKVYLVLDKQNMQGMGSALTYARRYALAGLFAIGQEDDDGNAAVWQQAPQKQTHQAPPPQTTQAPRGFGSRPVPNKTT